ncbi:hypothetical protein [Absidia glauca]|uniref:eRF1/Pelota-like N-terminal domain-containing protein n=1 Tax=Absidia glauca TaxID=4829 RepID=A0A163J390_ABSGL|nr:hypothetical protein [Absidia glauca]
MSAPGPDETDQNIEIWKMKKLIKNLEAARGMTAKMLADEYGTASNIKSRVNRLSVLSAITSTQQRLKLYNRVPPNGLVVYCGTIVTDEGKEKKVNIDFEPHKPINTSLYLCDNKFHTEALSELLEADAKFGFIVMDGNGSLFGTLSGNTRDAKIVKVVDVSYGGENGFNQAIELSAESLSNVKFVQEKKLVQTYFDEISQDTGKYCFGVEDTLKALELGAVESLIVWENLEINRYVLRDASGAESVVHPTKQEEKDKSFMVDKCPEAAPNADMEVVDVKPLLEWFADRYKDFGATLEFISNRSQEGNQFVRGFGGIGGILRYRVNFEQLNYDSDEFFSDDDYI